MKIELPFVLRSRYDRDVAELKTRLLDLERHFVTERDSQGNVLETLADIPVEKRKDKKRLSSQSLRGASWPQRRAWLEATDGGRKVG